MEVLYLNNKRVDLPNKGINRTIAISDIGDIGARKSSSSYTFTLPLTINNIRVLDMLGIDGVVSPKPYEHISVYYLEDSIPLISNGYAIISKSSNGIDVNLFDGIIDLSKRLDGLFLSHLPLEDMSHILNTQTYFDSFTNKSGYIYAYGDFGRVDRSTNIVSIETQAPSIFVHTLFSKIFAIAGLNLSGSFFTTNENYLNEVITPTNGYLVQNIPLDEETKGSIIIDRYSVFERSEKPIEHEYINTITNNNLQDVTILSNQIIMNVSGDYNLSLTINYDSSNSYIVFYFKKNNRTQFSELLASPTTSGSGEKIFNFAMHFNIGDKLTFVTKASSGQDPFSSPELGQFILSFNMNGSFSMIKTTGGQLINPVDAIGNTSQLAFIKDVILRYGLILQPSNNSVNFDFRQIEFVLQDTSNAIDWTKKLNRIKSNNYNSGYARRNHGKFIYPTEIVTANQDGYISTANLNSDENKTIITSIFNIPNGAELSYKIPIFGEDIEPEEGEPNEGLYELLETPIKLMSIKLINKSISAKLFDGGINGYNGEIPYLSLDDINFNFYFGNYYKSFESIINNYKSLECEILFNPIDIYGIDFFKLVYLEQTGKYYYLNKVGYTPDSIATATLIEINKFPKNLPPSQIGSFTQAIQSSKTSILNPSFFLNGYLDPEGDLPKELKIIDGFNEKIQLEVNGVVITEETIIPFSNFDLKAIELVGGLDGYHEQFNFVISDTSSGEFSEVMGVMTLEVLSRENQPPYVDVGQPLTVPLEPSQFQRDINITLNGSGSRDETGNIIDYFWILDHKEPGTFATVTNNRASPYGKFVVFNSLSNIGHYIIKLLVTDQYGLSAEKTQTIEVVRGNWDFIVKDIIIKDIT